MSLPEDEDAEERTKAVHNERTKLTATYLNGVTIALLAVGTLSPIIASPASNAPTNAIVLQAIIGMICLVGSVVLHYRARAVLKGLK